MFLTLRSMDERYPLVSGQSMARANFLLTKSEKHQTVKVNMRTEVLINLDAKGSSSKPNKPESKAKMPPNRATVNLKHQTEHKHKVYAL